MSTPSQEQIDIRELTLAIQNFMGQLSEMEEKQNENVESLRIQIQINERFFSFIKRLDERMTWVEKRLATRH